MHRTINRTFKAEKINMGGIVLDQALPVGDISAVDPFLLIHHWFEHYPGGQQQRNLGVGPHPHRGFAPVTLVFKGAVHHRDSEGNDSIVEAGGTQWMNAGRGIIHSERPSDRIAVDGGEYEIIQFWVNAPADKKLESPFYQPLTAEETKSWESPDNLVKIQIIAGELFAQRSRIKPYSPMLILNLKMASNGECDIPIPSDYNALLYTLNGSVSIQADSSISDKQMALYNNDGDSIRLRAQQDSRAILLAGKPLNERISTYGPFVMNSQKELMDAIRDYQDGKMGQLVEQFD